MTGLITIRRAQQQDAPIAAELISVSMDRFGDAALGFGDHARMLHHLERLFAQKYNRLSHDACWLAELDSHPAGALLAYPGWQYGSRSRRMGLQIFRAYGLAGGLRLIAWSFPLAAGKETERDEFYISNIATAPLAQRKGVGARLMALAEEMAVTAGLRKCSLIVELDNTRAQAFYHKLGYTIIATINTPHLKERYHTAGYHRMVKKINA
jgi:ribosomal protein S18 acetylase RimI-like enzyme